VVGSGGVAEPETPEADLVGRDLSLADGALDAPDDDLGARYPKIAVLGTIPFYALSTFLMFMKARQNFAEHLVLNTYRACGEIIISMFISLAAIFTKEITILRGIYSVVTILLFFYNTVFYWQYFKNDYRNKMLLWIRAFIAALLFIVMITLFFALIAFLLPGRN
jgi:hypothetical protein